MNLLPSLRGSRRRPTTSHVTASSIFRKSPLLISLTRHVKSLLKESNYYNSIVKDACAQALEASIEALKNSTTGRYIAIPDWEDEEGVLRTRLW